MGWGVAVLALCEVLERDPTTLSWLKPPTRLRFRSHQLQRRRLFVAPVVEVSGKPLDVSL